MKRISFNCITSLPNKMTLEKVETIPKEYEKSIVDKSCFTTIGEQLKKLTPMTPNEAEQHFDFIDGKDNGKKMPLRKGADLAEVTENVRMQTQAIKTKIDSVTKEVIKESKAKSQAESLRQKAQMSTNNLKR